MCGHGAGSIWRVFYGCVAIRSKRWPSPGDVDVSPIKLAPVTRIYTLHILDLSISCSEVSVVHSLAQSLTTLAHEQKFIVFEASGIMQYGWTLAQYGQANKAARDTARLVVFQTRGLEGTLGPYYLALLAESYRTIGQVEDALQALTQALALVDKSGGNWYELTSIAFRVNASSCSLPTTILQPKPVPEWPPMAPKPASQILRVKGCYQPCTTLAASRQTPGSL